MNQYTIDQFSKLTGLNKILIRTWENRYNFMTPKRTSTNIRYYDNFMLTQGIKYAILSRNGYKISKLINLNENDLNKLLETALTLNGDLNLKYEVYISKLIESAIFFNQKQFNQVYNDCINDIGFDSFYKEVLIKTMNKVGILWLNSEINPAHEHFLSENIRIKLSNEIEKTETTKNKTKWVLFLPEDEFHDIGLLFAYLILKTNKEDVIYLGQNLPRETLLSLEKGDYKFLMFIVSNKAKGFTKELCEFMTKNFKKSDINIITKQASKEVSGFKNIHNINNLGDFVKKLNLKKN